MSSARLGRGLAPSAGPSGEGQHASLPSPDLGLGQQPPGLSAKAPTKSESPGGIRATHLGADPRAGGRFQAPLLQARCTLKPGFAYETDELVRHVPKAAGGRKQRPSPDLAGHRNRHLEEGGPPPPGDLGASERATPPPSQGPTIARIWRTCRIGPKVLKSSQDKGIPGEPAPSPQAAGVSSRPPPHTPPRPRE